MVYVGRMTIVFAMSGRRLGIVSALQKRVALGHRSAREARVDTASLMDGSLFLVIR